MAAIRELVDKIDRSAWVLSIPPTDPADHKVATELGLAIMLDKPIVVLCWPGRDVPPGLARVATRIVELERRPADYDPRDLLALLPDDL